MNTELFNKTRYVVSSDSADKYIISFRNNSIWILILPLILVLGFYTILDLSKETYKFIIQVLILSVPPGVIFAAILKGLFYQIELHKDYIRINSFPNIFGAQTINAAEIKSISIDRKYQKRSETHVIRLISKDSAKDLLFFKRKEELYVSERILKDIIEFMRLPERMESENTMPNNA
ncbi:MAG: hypothetical protein Q8O72_11950 [Bacteroidales bacterium]|nr:hypothetical protein [Bacteroidales bacterium]